MVVVGGDFTRIVLIQMNKSTAAVNTDTLGRKFAKLEFYKIRVL